MQEGYVICYKSKNLKQNENNYANNDLEIYTTCSQYWRHYMLGRIFELIIDCMSLKYLFDQPILNSRKARWKELLCEFDFEIKHVKGKENKVAHALRRKFHVATKSICQSYLRERVIDVAAKDEEYLQFQEGLQKENLNKKYEGSSQKEIMFLFTKEICTSQIVQSKQDGTR